MERLNLLLGFLQLVLQLGTVVQGLHVYNTFSPSSPDIVLNHLSVDNQTGRVYIGAVNNLYQLNRQLSLEKTQSTGPRLDSVNCPGPEEEGDSTCTDRVETPNVNKILAIDQQGGHLITCGTLYQGICQVRSLGDVTQISVEYTPDFSRYVATNSPSNTTVGFVAPGTQPYEENALYVGSTYGEHHVIRENVPAVSIRSLEPSDIFKVVNDDKAKFMVRSESRQQYLISYVHGFRSKNHAYFATFQMERIPTPGDDPPPFWSKLIRLCIGDANFYSYMEIPLKCLGQNGTNYNLLQAVYVSKPGQKLAQNMGLPEDDEMLFGVFSASKTPSGKEPLESSALCVFSMSEIDAEFNKVQKACYTEEGGGIAEPLDFGGGTCLQQREELLERFPCGADFTAKQFGGTEALTRTAVAEFPTTGLTSVAASTVNGYTTAFLGTTNGKLIKVLVWNGDAANPYEEITVVQGSRVQQDMQFDAFNPQNLYVMTENKVTLVKVAECGQYDTCEACHGAGDPYCGWCTLENKCSQKQECNGHNEVNRWLSVDVDRCIEITQIDPPNLAREGPRTSLTLEVVRMPDGGQKYDCSFRHNSVRFSSPANFDNNGKLVCEGTPPPAQIPSIPPGRDHVTVDLWVRVRETDRYIVKAQFDFFDCNALKSCNPCVTSTYDCNWCVSDNKCTHNIADNCQPGGTTVAHGQRNSCPRITQLMSEELIPVGLPKAINMSASNVPDNADDFRCSLLIQGVYVTTEATYRDGIIYCSPMQYTYREDVQELAVALGASWGRSNIIDNPLGETVTLYKCSSQRTDCSLCVTAAPRYSCGWCGDTCTVRQVCQNRGGTWELMNCPAPTITDFSPKSGPVNGGTSVTITGVNMGQRFTDIMAGVTIAGQSCRPIEDQYSISNKIVCITGQAMTTTSGTVEVQVGGNSNQRGQSSDIFYYRDPRVTGFSPEVGPQSGGTKVLIMGELFDTGGEVTARIGRSGDNMWAPCVVDESSRTNVSVKCQTGRIDATGRYTLQVLFDGQSRDAPGKFNYTDDPTVMEVFPLKSFSSGGRQLTVRGTNLRIVQNAGIRVSTSTTARRKRQATEASMSCDIQSDSMMTCPSPDMGNSTGDVDLTFQLDNVRISLANLPGCQVNPDNCKFVYVPNPEYFKFENNPKLHTGGILAIEGRNLDQASFQDDVQVTIGSEICNVTSLDDDTLTCEPPESQPPGLDSDGKTSKEILPIVVVRVGNLRFEIGKLQYQIPPAGLAFWAIILIAAAGGFLVLIIIALLFIMRSKKKEANRRYEKIMVQMDTLESNVRNECKKAFAELQTDMTDLTSDLGGTGIPFLDYRTYMMRVLFPGQDMHPVLKETNVRESRRVQWEQAMNQFSALLNNKHFLLTFIRIMEESRESFSSRDKVNVASLLTVALHGKMEYYTDILKTLLLQMIEKSVERNPKLMLRRTESVVDKMLTNWLSISLYPFLKETAGQPLFMLYKAIKYQVEKGPVDAILGFARYSITEDRLLREQVDHEVLTLNVVSLPGGPSGHMPFTVKALSCDTITQVKDKILDMAYKNIPYSTRLHADECELEWRHGRAGQLILRDTDVTSETNHRWKKLNTLEHYKVPDSCSVALLRKPEQQMKLDRTFENLGVNQSLSSSSLAPLMQGDPEEGCRYWHLQVEDSWVNDNFSNHRNHKVKARDELERSNSVKRDSRFLKEQRAIPEIYLTRLLATKGTLQKFVDDAFSAILCTSPVPPSIKYFFDLLDHEAKKHGIDDPETLHIWKTNSVPLRFWVNVLKNPEFVFDIFKLGIVDACLSVIAQTFIDSCSAAEHKLGKDSPSNKLLYAREIPQYRQKVQTYYREVQQMTAVSDQEMITLLVEETKDHTHEFNTLAAVNELYDYAMKYQDQLLDALEEDTTCQRMQLAHKFENISANMEGETDV
ncbi:PREDICTED: plexin-A1-like isoform X2 [Branchiostoma belcheri]|uniref:Plexin-A1-like isoform X2 n=1 Tax=Branchiostoma belcheri TaxID=7741 RepID=A0A6P4ZWV4_BRABE|nr:PREDICTED: plexin-A1-like isoform X2 [Branchiostoma belcheri]